jgi:CRISPR-associated protein Cst2
MKVQGFLLLDVDVVALNNAGKSSSSNFDNAVATKKIIKNGRTYVYVSGQAWRYWWRDTLQKNYNWDLSPVTRESKIAFTEANPLKYPDDDIFGYMRAATEMVKDEKSGKEKKENVTVTRVSPLKNSAIVSAGSVRVAENWSSMARQEGDSVPYGKEEYSGIMKGMFSLDLEQVGTFSNYNKTGFKNITDKFKEDALAEGASEINDKFLKDKKGEPLKLVRLSSEVRKRRVVETLSALKTISGGAMQTNNMGDVTPKFLILASMETGNHPFSHVVTSSGIGNDQVSLNIEGIEQILVDYKDQIKGTVYIGRRSGFLEEYSKDLKELADKFENIKLLSVNQAIDEYSKEVTQFI